MVRPAAVVAVVAVALAAGAALAMDRTGDAAAAAGGGGGGVTIVEAPTTAPTTPPWTVAPVPASPAPSGTVTLGSRGAIVGDRTYGWSCEPVRRGVKPGRLVARGAMGPGGPQTELRRVPGVPARLLLLYRDPVCADDGLGVWRIAYRLVPRMDDQETAEYRRYWCGITRKAAAADFGCPGTTPNTVTTAT